MVTTISAQDITLAQLRAEFGLNLTQEAQFFQEWQDELPEISNIEQQRLDEVKQSYLHLSQYPMLEEIVKMVVLSPLLQLAGFYHPPFYLAAEKEVQIVSEDEGTVVRGRIDILVSEPEFWVVVIEAKRAEFSLKVGIPQALTYMLANPHRQKPAFGFVTNGGGAIFLKLTKQKAPKYALSNEFSLLNQGNDLYSVLRIFKKLSTVLTTQSETL